MSFAELIGNEALVRHLTHMARTRSVPPSLLFVGPSGVGKLAAAIALAQAMNCQESEDDACGKCSTCLRIAKGEHADVRLVRPEGAGRQLKADAVRQVVGEIPSRPFEGRRRFAIFVNAERMNPKASNILLKTLEEPPAWAVLILVTSNDAALLPTILSRCQIFRFAPLAPDALAALLETRYELDADRAQLLAALSGGSLTHALELVEEPLSELRLQALRLTSVAVQVGGAQELVSWADRLAKDANLLLVLQLVLGMVRDVTSAKAGGKLVHQDLESEIGQLASKATLDIWLLAYGIAESALVDVRDRYLNKRITVTRLLQELSALSN